MSEWALVAGLIVGGVILGYVLSHVAFDQSRAIESAWRIPFNALWLLAGAFMIVGGYEWAGVFLLVMGSYFLFSNTKRIRQSDMATSPGGWRSKIGNWRPFDGRRG